MILLPLPKEIKEHEGNYLIGLDTMIVIDPSCPQGAAVYAQMLKEEIKAGTGFSPAVIRGASKPGDIILKVDEALGEDRYRLTSGETGAAVCGGSLRSMGWGIQTLRQIVRGCAGILPALTVSDEPDMENRGFYHDMTRGRVQTLDHLKELVDTMVFYKMTQLQLYVEHTYLYREFTEIWRDETPLCAEEIMELDAYCDARGIELVPSIATFGHLYKLLGSKTYAQYCELPDSDGKQFRFTERMDHHTFNVSDPGAAGLAKQMIGEYMHLFRSDKFNICADETFDLGKGKSSALAEEKGTGRLYVDFILELFAFLQENGKTPMFWGDIICHYPELLKQLPKETICLNWGYSETQRDAETRILHEAGATQYVCPGVCGWNTWVNAIRSSFENIRRMCSYGRKYEAIGVLNTDWGDFGHVNHPAFSIPGLIYGAVLSWGDAALDFDEMNRRISILQYGDTSGKLVGCLANICGQSVFSWCHVIFYKEWGQKGISQEKIINTFREEDMTGVKEACGKLDELGRSLREISRSMDRRNRRIVWLAEIAMEAARVWNLTGEYISCMLDGEEAPCSGMELAARLERCLYHYKEAWRENSKEGDLPRITNVFAWYADLLRDDYRKRKQSSGKKEK